MSMQARVWKPEHSPTGILKKTLAGTGILMLTVFTAPAAAGEGWNLDVLKALALKQSPVLTAQAYRTRAAGYDKTGAALEFIPPVSLQTSYTNYQKVAQGLTYAEPDPYRVNDYSVSVSLPLMGELKNYFAYTSAALALDIQKARWRKSAESVLENLVATYFRVLSAQANEQHQTFLIKAYREEIEIIKEKQKAHSASLLELKEAQLQLQKAVHGQHNWMFKKKQLLVALSDILNVDAGFWKKEKQFNVPMSDAGKAPGQAELRGMGSPDLELGRLNVEKARQSITVERLNYAPSMDINGKFGYHSINMSLPEYPQQNYSCGFDISWKLNSLYSIRQKTGRKKQEAKACAEDLENTKRRFNDKIQQQYESLAFAIESIKSGEALHQLQEKRLEIIETEYKAGLVSLSERNRVRLEDRNAEIDLKMAELELQKNLQLIQVLHGSTGRTIK